MPVSSLKEGGGDINGFVARRCLQTVKNYYCTVKNGSVILYLEIFPLEVASRTVMLWGSSGQSRNSFRLGTEPAPHPSSIPSKPVDATAASCQIIPFGGGGWCYQLTWALSAKYKQLSGQLGARSTHYGYRYMRSMTD